MSKQTFSKLDDDKDVDYFVNRIGIIFRLNPTKPVGHSSSVECAGLKPELCRQVQFLYYKQRSALEALVTKFEKSWTIIHTPERKKQFDLELLQEYNKAREALQRRPISKLADSTTSSTAASTTPSQTATSFTTIDTSSTSTDPCQSSTDTSFEDALRARNMASMQRAHYDHDSTKSQAIVQTRPEAGDTQQHTNTSNMKTGPAVSRKLPWQSQASSSASTRKIKLNASILTPKTSRSSQPAVPILRQTTLSTFKQSKRIQTSQEEEDVRAHKRSKTTHEAEASLAEQISKAGQEVSNNQQGRDCITHQIREFEYFGIGFEYRDGWPGVPYHLCCELSRLQTHFALQRTQLHTIRSYDGIRKLLATLDPELVASFKCSPQLQINNPNLGLSLSASMRPRWSKSTLFDVVLQPLKLEKTCRIQRRFGHGRLLYVDVDLTDRALSSTLRGEAAAWREYVFKWLRRPCQFLGYTWEAFHWEEVKKKSRERDAERRAEKATSHNIIPRQTKLPWRVVFFATEGSDINKISLEKFMTWALAPAYNSAMSACKASSRIDLLLSRTTATYQFSCDQIRMVDDIKAQEGCEDEVKTSTGLTTRRLRAFDPNDIMTDGCARVSVGAAIKICQALGEEQVSAFQARCFGSKGMWFVSAPYDTTNAADLDIWIEIRPSQLKVRYAFESNDRGFSLAPGYEDDTTLLSFDVVKMQHTPRTSEIHSGFLPIFIDRGIPKTAITAYAEKSVNNDKEDLEQACDDPISLAKFVGHSLHDSMYAEDAEILGTPRNHITKLAKLLWDGGFMPADCKTVAEIFLKECERSLLRKLLEVKFRSSRSTMLFGIADPTGTLPPNTVNIRFAEGVIDTSGIARQVSPHNKHALLARHPSLRGSDIQKVRIVDMPQLAHLTDLVIFPVQGSIPLAGKLQGGDYDGDTFWVCWDDEFVSSFTNAPLVESYSAASYGIVKDTTQIAAFLKDGQFQCRQWLDHIMGFKFADRLLGVVTNHLSAITSQQSLWSETALVLSDLHDHLIDSAKNGYTYNLSDLNAKLKALGAPLSPHQPAWQRSRTEIEFRYRSSDNKEVGSAIRNTTLPKGGSQSIIDHIHFDILLHHAVQSMNMLQKKLERAPKLDQDLLHATNSLTSYMSKHNISEQDLRHTRDDIDNVLKCWHLTIQRSDFTTSIQQFKAIKPPSSLEMLAIDYRADGLSAWDFFKASILVKYHWHKYKAIAWLAFQALCGIKAGSEQGKKVIERLVMHRKVKRPKLRRNLDGVVENLNYMSALQVSGSEEPLDIDDETDGLLVTS